MAGHECFHCGQKTVSWQSDFDFDDYGYEGEGIVHVLHCSNCGAQIEYKVPTTYICSSCKHEGECKTCKYYDTDDDRCGAFECNGLDCPKLPCEEKE